MKACFYTTILLRLWLLEVQIGLIIILLKSLILLNGFWPLQGYVKINVDRSSKGNPSLAGFGGLIKADDEKWIIGYHGFIGYVGNLLTKLLAMCHGLRLAW